MLVAMAEACLVGDPVCTAILVLRTEVPISLLDFQNGLNTQLWPPRSPCCCSNPNSPTKATGYGPRGKLPHDVTTPTACFQRGSQESGSSEEAQPELCSAGKMASSEIGTKELRSLVTDSPPVLYTWDSERDLASNTWNLEPEVGGLPGGISPGWL